MDGQVIFLSSAGELGKGALSPYLFILLVEALANAIRGISLKDKWIKLSQYADNTTLILDGSEESLLESLKIIDHFSNISGLRINSKKTEALWIGKCTDWDFKLCPEKDFNFQSHSWPDLIDKQCAVKMQLQGVSSPRLRAARSSRNEPLQLP